MTDRDFLEFLKEQHSKHSNVDEKIERLNERMLQLIEQNDKRIDKIERAFLVLVAYLVGTGVVESLGILKGFLA